jgi:hypothetical protein
MARINLLAITDGTLPSTRVDSSDPQRAQQMQAVTSEDFRRWLAGAGIGFDPQYPDYLTLLPASNNARFWVVPADAVTWPHFITALLGGLDEWESGYLWPLEGVWPASARSKSANERVRDVMLRGAGIPDGWAGAVRFDRAEHGAVIAVLFVAVVFGWHGPDDLFFVPDHARQIVRTDHHDVLHAECGSDGRIGELVGHMATAGYDLPAEPPDWTFIRPAWMGGQ